MFEAPVGRTNEGVQEQVQEDYHHFDLTQILLVLLEGIQTVRVSLQLEFGLK